MEKLQKTKFAHMLSITRNYNSCLMQCTETMYEHLRLSQIIIRLFVGKTSKSLSLYFNLMKNYKNQYKKYKRMYKVQSEMREHYESLFQVWVGELRFRLLQIEHLLSVLNEVEVMTNDPLEKWVIKNWKERHHLDKLIHSRKLFE